MEKKDWHTKQACVYKIFPFKDIFPLKCEQNLKKRKFPAWFLIILVINFENGREIQIKNRYVLLDDLYADGILAVHKICTESTAVIY